MELGEKVMELVAVGASITANCQPCLQFHVEKAVGQGAGPEEIAAAIEVGKKVRKGASAKMDAFASGALPTGPAQAGKAESACCGGL